MSDNSTQNEQERKLPFLGFIFHVGLYSYFGYDEIESARKRKIQNGSEWFLARIQPQQYRKISGSEHALIYYNQFRLDYFKAPFLIERSSIQQWLDICVSCRASHVLITAKHHDGYCLWNTQTTENKSYNDVVLIFKQEAELRGLQFGIYYSWFEFLKPFNITYFNNICLPQIYELLRYNPGMIWFDGDWKITQKSIIEQINTLVRNIKSMGISVNDRITKENSNLANYYVGPDRNIPETQMQNWQHINTIGISWGYNREQQLKDYKTGKYLFDLLCHVSNNGGCLLLNIGPKHNGELDQNEVKALRDFSELIK